MTNSFVCYTALTRLSCQCHAYCASVSKAWPVWPSLGPVHILSWYPKIQWKPFWLAAQVHAQNESDGWQYLVNYDVFAQAYCTNIGSESKLTKPTDETIWWNVIFSIRPCKFFSVFLVLGPALIFANQPKKKNTKSLAFRFAAWNPTTKFACRQRYRRLHSIWSL